MAHVKMLAHRSMIVFAMAGACAAAVITAGAAADGCYWLGSMVVTR